MKDNPAAEPRVLIEEGDIEAAIREVDRDLPERLN
jgi:hypothetical protein